MNKNIIRIALVVTVFCFMSTMISCAADNKTGGEKAKSFWQKLFNYPANVTQESAKVVADTGVKGTAVVTKEVKTVGQVTSGEVAKTKELVTEPITGTAETAVNAVKGAAAVPVNAAKEEEPKAKTQ